VFGCTVVGFDPLRHRLTDMPGGIVPDEHEGAFALGRKGRGQPREKGTGDHADGTSPHKAQQHAVRQMAMRMLGKLFP
jgi:hypothetical protein